MTTTTSFFDALHAAGPAADRADKMRLYGWLIGDWNFDAVVHADDGTQHKGQGEIHFAWVLEGRGIQDVWILPGLSTARRCGYTTRGSTLGTSCGAIP